MPVIPPGKTVPVQFDGVNPAQYARINNFPHMLETGFKPAVLAAEQAARIFFLQLYQFFRCGARGCERLFDHSRESGFHGPSGMPDMIQ